MASISGLIGNPGSENYSAQQGGLIDRMDADDEQGTRLAMA